MFGSKARRIKELERQLEECQVMRNTFEFALINSREGRDEETNAFFRSHPVYVEPEPTADAGKKTGMARQAKSKRI